MAENPYESPQVVPAGEQTGLPAQKRPIGVWIAVIWSALFAGILPAGLTALFYYLSEEWRLWGIPYLLLGIALGAAVVLAAVGTFLGNSTSRYVLVALVAAHYGIVAYNCVIMASQGVETRGGNSMLIGRAIRSLVIAAVVAGLLVFSKRANAFFAHSRLNT